MASVLKEYHLSTNDFYEPTVSTDKTALGVLLVRLILLEPGTDPTRPHMGIGIVSRYRYMTPDSLLDLKRDLSQQISMYLTPYVSNVNIVLELSDGEIYFTINIDDAIYKFVTEEQEDNKVTLRQLTGTGF